MGLCVAGFGTIGLRLVTPSDLLPSSSKATQLEMAEDLEPNAGVSRGGHTTLGGCRGVPAPGPSVGSSYV